MRRYRSLRPVALLSIALLTAFWVAIVPAVAQSVPFHWDLPLN